MDIYQPGNSPPNGAAVPPLKPRTLEGRGREASQPSFGPPATVWLYARSLVHCWKTALACGIVLAIIAAAAARQIAATSVATTYKTSALVRLRAEEQLAGIIAAHPERQDTRTDTELVKSRFVLRAAVRQPEAAELPSVSADPEASVKRLEEQLKVEMLTPQILRISLTGTVRSELPVLVNAVRDAYLHEVIEAEQAHGEQRIALLQKLYNGCEQRLREKRATLPVAPADADGTGGPQPLARVRLESFQKELVRVQFELQRSRLRFARNGGAQSPGVVHPLSANAVAEVINKDPAVEQLLARIAKLTEVLAECQRVATDPESYAPIRTQRQNLDAALAARREALRPEVERHLRDQWGEANQAQNTRDREEIVSLEEDEKTLTLLTGIDTRALSRPASFDLREEMARHEIETLESTLRRVGQELEAARLAQFLPRQALPLQDAEEAIRVVGAREVESAVLAGSGAMLFVGLVFSWREVRSGRVYSARIAGRRLGLRILGGVPILPRRVRHRSSPANPADGAFARGGFTEALDSIRTLILHGAGSVPAPVIMVTSAVPGEGKSTLASHLAVSLARTGKRTLLLDGDLIRPTIHRVFGLHSEPGLSDLLRGTRQLQEAIRSTTVQGLSVLPGGKADEASLRGLTRNDLARIIQNLRQNFDAVVVDSCPILPVPHAQLLCKYVDTVVLALLRGISREPLADAACRRLAELGIPILGAVLNGDNAEASAYSYGYGYSPEPAPAEEKPRAPYQPPADRLAAR
jgi:capsular exopolysaccharide synthesis family protein